MRNIWSWLGFSRIDPCKVVLEKNFTENIDYKVYEGYEAKTAPEISGASLLKQNGGQNRQKVMLNIRTFKRLCIKSNTKKANEIHEYFIDLEEIILETLDEDERAVRKAYDSNNIERETIFLTSRGVYRLLEKFKDCAGVYFLKNPILRLCKFGSSKNVGKRVKEHRRVN